MFIWEGRKMSLSSRNFTASLSGNVWEGRKARPYLREIQKVGTIMWDIRHRIPKPRSRQYRNQARRERMKRRLLSYVRRKRTVTKTRRNLIECGSVQSVVRKAASHLTSGAAHVVTRPVWAAAAHPLVCTWICHTAAAFRNVIQAIVYSWKIWY